MPTAPLYDQTFRTELARLNPAQRAAVEQTDGPVMVLAGPGTGKTHLLAARIGNILTETDTGAHNILCLTFTEAGVRAMRERLLSFIGPDAHRIAIHTFHGFCSTLIRQNLQYFGKLDLEPLSDLEQIRIIRELLDGLEQDTPLRQGYHDPYFYEPYLRHLFAAMKSENWEVDYLEQRIARYVAGLDTHPDFTYKRAHKGKAAGDPREGLIAEEKLKMERLGAGVALFPAYQQALRRARRYDYGDMIGWVLRAFNDFPSLLLSYQERYQYVLVDEFQDTNGAQDLIVRSLVDYWENPNVFIVGDDDQAIYEFQGARLRSMVDFFQRYRDVKLVTLRDNYRSRQQILDVASGLIRRNALRIGNRLPELDVDKRLNAAIPDRRSSPAEHPDAAPAPAPADSPVRLLAFPDRQQEAGYLVHQLQAWHEGGTPWSEMAVIYAKHRQADELRGLLERADIPYRSKRRPNVLDGRPVRQLIDLLTFLQAEHDRPGTGEYLLFRVLHFRCFGLWPHDLAVLNRARLARKDSTGQFPSWRDFLQQPHRWPPELRAADAIERTAYWLEDMIGQIDRYPLPEYVEKAMNGAGLLAAVLRHPKRSELLQHLSTFSDFVVAEVARRPRLGLAGLLETLRQMDANRIELPLRSHLDQAEAVLLVTAHSAKGLEFDKVWLLDCAESKWGRGRGGDRGKFSLPDTLTFSGAEDEEEARRRLFYVALTRARTEVVLSVADRDARGRTQQRAGFLDEIITDAELPLERVSLAADQLTATTTLRLQPANLAKLPGLEDAAVAELLKDFRLSVSALYAYLKCPTAFFYEKLLGVPDLEREQTHYGSALHDALEAYFLRMKSDPRRQFPGKAELLYNFEQALGRRRGLLRASAYEQRLRQGKRELSLYYDRYRSSWTTDVEVELFIGNAEVDGVPLTGAIDRVDILGDAWVRVVDYKTSASKSGDIRKKTRPPTEAHPNGSDYWRQINFYKLLYDHRPGNIRRVKDGKISFLLVNPAGNQPEAVVPTTAKDQQALRRIISRAWAGIQAREFGGCGEQDCAWCRFVADLQDDVPLREVDDLDDAT